MALANSPTPQSVGSAAKAEAVPALPDHVPDVSRERAEAVPPITEIACESARGEEAVRVVVATPYAAPAPTEE